jgi:hypothetical protein
MPGAVARKLTVADAMLLVAALAIGLVWVDASKVADDNYRAILGPMSFVHEMVWTKLEKTWASLRTDLPCIITLMTALLVVGLRRPRPDLPHLMRQPGFVACSGVAFALVIEIVRALIFTLRQIVRHDWVLEAHGHHHRFLWLEAMLPQVSPVEVGLIVAAYWMALILGSRWRPQPQWLDRIGIAFGFFWIIWATVEIVEPWGFLEKDHYIKM